jgi:hypothetical protein
VSSTGLSYATPRLIHKANGTNIALLPGERVVALNETHALLYSPDLGFEILDLGVQKRTFTVHTQPNANRVTACMTKCFVIIHYPYEASIRAWNLSTGNMIVAHHTSNAQARHFTAVDIDGDTFACVIVPATRLYTPELVVGGKNINTTVYHLRNAPSHDPVLHICLSRNGRTVIASTQSGKLLVWVKRVPVGTFSAPFLGIVPSFMTLEENADGGVLYIGVAGSASLYRYGFNSNAGDEYINQHIENQLREEKAYMLRAEALRCIVQLQTQGYETDIAQARRAALRAIDELHAAQPPDLNAPTSAGSRILTPLDPLFSIALRRMSPFDTVRLSMKNFVVMSVNTDPLEPVTKRLALEWTQRRNRYFSPNVRAAAQLFLCIDARLKNTHKLYLPWEIVLMIFYYLVSNPEWVLFLKL